jgi:hypothetical protein
MSANAQNDTLESADNDTGRANAPVSDSTPASDNLASDLIAAMSEPSEHAIEQARSENEQKVNTPDGFDPSLHEADENGNPILTPTGRFKKISKNAEGKRNHKKSVLDTSRASGKDTARDLPSDPDSIARTSGSGAANLLLAFGMMIGGEEWQPRIDTKQGINEKAMLEQAFGDYFVATGKQDLPPGWALVACIGMYIAPRFTMPKTQSRFIRLKNWAVLKYVSWKLRKRGHSDEQIEKIVKARAGQNP